MFHRRNYGFRKRFQVNITGMSGVDNVDGASDTAISGAGVVPGEGESQPQPRGRGRGRGRGTGIPKPPVKPMTVMYEAPGDDLKQCKGLHADGVTPCSRLVKQMHDFCLNHAPVNIEDAVEFQIDKFAGNVYYIYRNRFLLSYEKYPRFVGVLDEQLDSHTGKTVVKIVSPDEALHIARKKFVERELLSKSV